MPHVLGCGKRDDNNCVVNKCTQVEFVFSCYDVGGRSRLSMSELFLLLKSTTAGLCKLSRTGAPDSARLESVASLVSLLPGRRGGGRTPRYIHKTLLARSCARARARIPPHAAVSCRRSGSIDLKDHRPPPVCRGDPSKPNGIGLRSHVGILTAASHHKLTRLSHCRIKSTLRTQLQVD